MQTPPRNLSTIRMDPPPRHLDTIVLKLKQKQPDNYSNLADITSYYTYKLRRLDALHEMARINEYIYAAPVTDDSIPHDLIEWYNLTASYIDKLHEEIAQMFTIKKNEIKEKRIHVTNLIAQKRKKHASNEARHQSDTALELATLQRIQQLPDDIINYIAAFVLTPNIRLALYRLPKTTITSSITQMKNPLAKEFMKRLRERALTITFQLYNVAVKPGIIKQADYAPLHNLFGQTKNEMNKSIYSAIECYEYIHNIIKHKKQCNQITPLVTNELLYIYKITKYISRPEFNKRAKPKRRILQNPENQPAQAV